MPKLLDEIVAARGDELALADEFGLEVVEVEE